jgi:hypothetical protein
MKTKRSILLLITSILSTAYFIYLITYFGGAIGSTTGSEQAGAALATALVLPHMILIAVGALFSWLGFFIRMKGFALVGAISFTVALVVFLPYFMFSAPLLILGFISFANQNKLSKAAAASAQEQISDK